MRQLDVSGTRWHNVAAVLAKQDKMTLDGKPPGVIFLAQRLDIWRTRSSAA
jgi:hypothetical protein